MVALVPQRDPIAAADAFGVLEEPGRPRHHAAGQPGGAQGVRGGLRVSPHPFLSPPIAHLGPEFPVTRDRGWEPRPRSSSPASTTTERPMMSQTWGAHGARARDPPQRFGAQGGPPSPPHGLTFRRESSMRKAARPSASAQMLPRSPACYGAEWGGQGRPQNSPPHPPVPGVPQAHPVLVLRSPVALPVRVEMVPAAVGGTWGEVGVSPFPIGVPVPHWGVPVPH